MNRIDHGADAATVTSVHRIETRAIDAERGVGSDEMLNVQGEVGGNDTSNTSNIQGGIGGEC
jgi:hypothetical protein